MAGLSGNPFAEDAEGPPLKKRRRYLRACNPYGILDWLLLLAIGLLAIGRLAAVLSYTIFGAIVHYFW